MFDDSSAVMPIYWKDTSLKSLLPVRMNVPAESKVKTRKIIEQEAWMDEKYLKKNEIPFRLFWVYRDFFAGCKSFVDNSVQSKLPQVRTCTSRYP